MGIHVKLGIIPQRIAPGQWAEAYDEVLHLLHQHPSRLMGLQYRLVDGVRVAAHTRSLEVVAEDPSWRCWHVVGDWTSGRTGESAIMYRDLQRYPRCEDAEDILLLDPVERPPTRVFGDKTQGLPYHLPLLAAALVVENRLPGAAWARGDIDRDQAEAARAWAGEVLGRPLALPVSVDAPALRERLARFHRGEPLVAAFASLYLGERDQLLAAIGAELGEPALRSWLLGEIARHGSPAEHGALQLLAAWLDTDRPLEELCELCCLEPRGPRFEAEALARAVAWIAIPRQETPCPGLLARPPGQPMTSDQQIAAVGLDLYLPGWRLRRHLEQQAIARAFSAAFGAGRLPRLLAALEQRIGEVRARLAGVRQLLAAAQPRGDDEAAWPAAPDGLNALQRERLELLALTLGPASPLRPLLLSRVPPLAGALRADPSAMRRVIAVIVTSHNIILTEDAWRWIAAETDRELLALLAVLAPLSAPSLGRWFAGAIKALLQSRDLALYLLHRSRQQATIERQNEVAEAIERARGLLPL